MTTPNRESNQSNQGNQSSQVKFVGFHLEAAIHRDLKLVSVAEQKTLRDCWREATLLWLATDPEHRDRLVHDAARKLGYEALLSTDEDDDTRHISDRRASDSDISDLKADSDSDESDEMPPFKMGSGKFDGNDFRIGTPEMLQPLIFESPSDEDSDEESGGLQHGDSLIVNN